MMTAADKFTWTTYDTLLRRDFVSFAQRCFRELWSPDRIRDLGLVVLGDRRKAHDLPILLRQYVADQIVLVQPVHDHHDRTLLLVVEATVEGMVEPLVGRPPLALRQGLLGLQRIVDDDQVGTAPGQYPADRGREPAALRRRLELRHRLPFGREARREEPLVPVAGEDPPAVARQFVGELLRIADAEDLRRRIVPETPCGKGDRGQQRLQITRRQVDDQPPDLAGAHRHQFRGDDLDMPVHHELGPRAQLAEATLREADKIVPQQCVVGAPGELVGGRHHSSGPAFSVVFC